MGDADFGLDQGVTLGEAPPGTHRFDAHFFNASPHVLFVVNQRGEVLQGNPAFHRLAGDVKHIAHFLNAQPLAQLEDKVRLVFEGETSPPFELVVDAGESGNRVLLTSAFPLYDEGGVVACGFNAMDVTPKAVRRKQLEDLEAFFAQVLFHLPVALAVMDTEGRHLYLNPAAVNDPSLRHWAIGKDVVAYFGKLGIDQSVAVRRQAILQRAVDEKRVVTFDEYVVGVKGKAYYFHRIVAPVLDEHGTVDFVLEVGEDITTREEMKYALLSSRKRLESYMEQAPFAIIRWNSDFTVKSWNATAEAIFGFTANEVLGKHPADFLVPATRRAEVKQIFKKLKRGMVGNHNVSENLTKSGELLVCSWYNTPIPDEDGRFYEAVSVAHDITGRTRRSQMRAHSEERFRKLVQNASDIITVIDENGIIRYVSPSVYRVFGYNPERLLDVCVIDLVHPDDQAAARDAFVETINFPRETPFFELRIAHAKGHWVHTETVTSNLMDDPRVGGLVMNTRDISERKAIERGLIAAKEEAEAMARIKNTIVNNISHEVRTPLTAILGFAEVLVEEVPPEHREFAELVYTSGKRLMQTLNSVLDFSRLESGEMSLKFEEVDVLTLVLEAHTLFTSQAEQKNISLLLEKPVGPVVLSLDPNAFSRILSNLLSNAIKFTPSQGTVTVRVEDLENKVQLHVSDTGIGMSESFLPQLFQEFKQESEGLSRQHRGSGLGLAITRRLVEALHGKISVQSKQGHGSTFTVMFPKWEDLT